MSGLEQTPSVRGHYASDHSSAQKLLRDGWSVASCGPRTHNLWIRSHTLYRLIHRASYVLSRLLLFSFHFLFSFEHDKPHVLAFVTRRSSVISWDYTQLLSCHPHVFMPEPGRAMSGADGLPWWSPNQVLANICCVCTVMWWCMCTAIFVGNLL